VKFSPSEWRIIRGLIVFVVFVAAIGSFVRYKPQIQHLVSHPAPKVTLDTGYGTIVQLWPPVAGAPQTITTTSCETGPLHIVDPLDIHLDYAVQSQTKKRGILTTYFQTGYAPPQDGFTLMKGVNQLTITVGKEQVVYVIKVGTEGCDYQIQPPGPAQLGHQRFSIKSGPFGHVPHATGQLRSSPDIRFQ